MVAFVYGTIIILTHYRGYNLVNAWLLSKAQNIYQGLSYIMYPVMNYYKKYKNQNCCMYNTEELMTFMVSIILNTLRKLLFRLTIFT